MHNETHEHAGQSVTLKPGTKIPNFNGTQYRIEDWWDKLTGKGWGESEGNPAALMYAMRSGFGHLPFDDEVVYGHDEASIGHIVHVSELVFPASDEENEILKEAADSPTVQRAYKPRRKVESCKRCNNRVTLQSEGFLEDHTVNAPSLSGNMCEGSGERPEHQR